MNQALNQTPGQAAIRNAMTIDVEDYFQVSAFAPTISRESWPSLPCRVERNIDLILSILHERNIKATFFTLGWIAERYPAMVKRIVANGHELASHGYGHLRVTDQQADEFVDDITRSKALLEDIGGHAVLGYRAPSFSIGSGNLWALDLLRKAGYRYSSSIYPVKHDHYGMPDAPRFAFYPNGKDGLLEVPVSTIRLFQRNYPAGGGGFFRFFPYAMSRWLLQRVNQQDLQPAIFYFHPWELDPDQPRQQGVGLKTRFRHYVNLHRTENRIKALARDFQWGPDGPYLSRECMNAINESCQPHPSNPLATGMLPTVHLMQPGDTEKWDEFVLACPQTSFFHRAGWKEVIERAFGHRTHFLYAESEGRIQGVLPLAQINSFLFGHSLSSLPFCVYGGIAATSQAAADALDRAAQELATTLKVDYLEYRNRHPHNPAWPTKNLYVTFRKDIDPDEEKNMLAIPRKQRAMVRKGIKAGLQGTIDQQVDRFFAAYSASVHRLGTPVFSKKYFRLLKEIFAEHCEILTITKEGRTVSSVMSFYFRDEVLPYYGGGTAEARDVAGNDFMYWELMRRSCERGIRVFDFGRSKQGTGSFDFKKNWGFEPQPLHYEYQLHRAQSIPDTNPLNPKYQLMIKTWQRLPLFVANAIGPHIVKNLG